jgi:hypothetical protein
VVTPSLHPVTVQLNRADEHFECIYRAAEAFLKTDPYGVAREFQAAERKHVWFAVLRDEVPDKLLVRVGECLQCIRSALDYLAWQLALAQTDNPRQSTAFPIFASPTDYARDKERYIGDIDPTIHSEFDAVQPCNRSNEPRRDPLWVLHRLNNDHKHKLPNIVGALPKGVGFNLPDIQKRFMTMTIGAFEDGDEVASITYREDVPDLEMQGQAYFEFSIGFGKSTAATGLLDLGAEIEGIRREVDLVIARFDRFFA